MRTHFASIAFLNDGLPRGESFVLRAQMMAAKETILVYSYVTRMYSYVTRVMTGGHPQIKTCLPSPSVGECPPADLHGVSLQV